MGMISEFKDFAMKGNVNFYSLPNIITNFYFYVTDSKTVINPTTNH